MAVTFESGPAAQSYIEGRSDVEPIGTNDAGFSVYRLDLSSAPSN